MCSPHKIQYDILQELYFYFGKNADFYFRIFCEVSEFCVVAKRGSAFFGVCNFGCTHFFIFRRKLKMTNMFSGNQEKKIPRNFKDCYKTDSITQNLWLWCERLEKWGYILFWILIVIGVIDTIIAGINAHQLIEQIGAETVEEIREASAEMGIEIPTVFEALVNNLLSWTLYSFLEYCAYHILALLVGSLATIVQHTKITANISLYNSAKTEGVSDDCEEECKEEPNKITGNKKADIKTNKIPNGFKKCAYCKKISPVEIERCSCGCLAFENNNSENKEEANDENQTISFKCDMCGCESEKITYAKIDDDMGTRYRNICDKCMEQYNATPAKK